MSADDMPDTLQELGLNRSYLRNPNGSVPQCHLGWYVAALRQLASIRSGAEPPPWGWEPRIASATAEDREQFRVLLEEYLFDGLQFMSGREPVGYLDRLAAVCDQAWQREFDGEPAPGGWWQFLADVPLADLSDLRLAIADGLWDAFVLALEEVADGGTPPVDNLRPLWGLLAEGRLHVICDGPETDALNVAAPLAGWYRENGERDSAPYRQATPPSDAMTFINSRSPRTRADWWSAVANAIWNCEDRKLAASSSWVAALASMRPEKQASLLKFATMEARIEVARERGHLALLRAPGDSSPTAGPARWSNARYQELRGERDQLQGELAAAMERADMDAVERIERELAVPLLEAFHITMAAERGLENA